MGLTESSSASRDYRSFAGGYSDDDLETGFQDYGRGERMKRNFSWHFENMPYNGPHTMSLKQQFLAKVYGALSLQLLVTVCFCAYFMYNEEARLSIIKRQSQALWSCFVLSLSSLLALLCCYKTVFPINVALFSVFTIAESVMVSIACAVYYEAGYGQLVLQAWMITASLFIALTLFATQSRIDFGFLGMGLFASLWVMLLWGTFAMIFGVQPGWLYGLFGSLVFCLYILFDTWKLTKIYGYDDWLLASIDLYLDVLNLFLYVLYLLIDRKN
eukprot:gb/GEZN01008213.1/.p1 GENE.gb/GEZN01008213.1/~~gb/GEZN01008213.1/.p1  ORF type:complete len:279 (-),score=18.83 gb/GEZN01008213.1/:617-1432(-)